MVNPPYSHRSGLWLAEFAQDHFDQGVDVGVDHRLAGHAHPVQQGSAGLPLVLHVHGGGFVGTAVQCDWANSHLAARLPAVVVSVEHRLLAPDIPLSAAIDDGWDVLRHVVQHAAEWGIDPARAAVFGESAGSMVTALAAIRARDSDLRLQAQVLVNPCVDLTSTAFDGHLLRSSRRCSRGGGSVVGRGAWIRRRGRRHRP